MNNILRALAWAAAIMAVALASAIGWVSEDFAQTMVIVLPIMAVMSLRDAGGCAPCPLFSGKGEA